MSEEKQERRTSRYGRRFLSWNLYFVFLFFYRCVYSVLGEIVVARVTLLGDSKRYIRAGLTVDADLVQAAAGSFSKFRNMGTFLTESLANLVTIVLGNQAILVHLAFQTIAFYGIYRFILSLDGSNRKIAAIIVLSPTFSLWSSVTGKEAIIIFCFGIILSGIASNIEKTGYPNFRQILALLILSSFKIQYLISILFLWLGMGISGRFRQKSVIAIIGGTVSLVPLYLFRDKLNDMSFKILPHFEGTGGFTREPFWTEQYDVFLRAPYGMFQTFFGPTIDEALAGPFQMISFFESLTMATILGVVLLLRFPRIPVFSAVMSLFSIFWMMFPNYPLGVMNPGSAVRYRTGYLLFILFCILVITSRERYVTWASRPRRRALAMTPAESSGAPK